METREEYLQGKMQSEIKETLSYYGTKELLRIIEAMPKFEDMLAEDCRNVLFDTGDYWFMDYVYSGHQDVKAIDAQRYLDTLGLPELIYIIAQTPEAGIDNVDEYLVEAIMENNDFSFLEQ